MTAKGQKEAAAPAAGGAAKVVIIAGMHRSGTSLVARVCNLLGLALGTDLMTATDDNRSGYWEHLGIVAAHDRLLQGLGLGWDATEPLPPDWQQHEETERCREALRAIIAADFAGEPFWGFKDPRVARLIPLWLELLAEQGARPHFIIPYRHPAAVARSLHRRDGFSAGKGELLWLVHLLEADAASRGYPASFVDDNLLLTDWRAAASRMAADLGLDWPVAMEDCAGAVEAFIDPALRHDGGGDRPAPESGLIARALEAVAAGDPGRRARGLDAVRAAFFDAGMLFAPWREETALTRDIAFLRGEIVKTRRHVEMVEEARDQLEAALTREIDTLRGEIVKAGQHIEMLEDTRRKLQAELHRTNRRLEAAHGDIADLAARGGRMTHASLSLLGSSRWRLGHGVGNALALARLRPTGCPAADDLVAEIRGLERWHQMRRDDPAPVDGKAE